MSQQAAFRPTARLPSGKRELSKTRYRFSLVRRRRRVVVASCEPACSEGRCTPARVSNIKQVDCVAYDVGGALLAFRAVGIKATSSQAFLLARLRYVRC